MAEEISRKSVIYDILYDFKRGNASADQAEKKLKGLDRVVGGLEGTFKQLAGAIVGALTLQKVAQFTQEALKLAAAAEGVRTAFNRLNNPNLLSELRKATRNTITDLELMKAAVRAENFKIPLDKLAGFFQFAQQRARATGESVEFLVDSIVTGIGRKSTLVLDNLGISAVELQEEIKKVGDFGVAAANIIEREMKKAGDSAETAADKFAQFNTALENLKLIFGEILLPPFTEALGDLSSVMQKLGDDTESTSKKLGNLLQYFLTGDNPISAWFKDITGISTVTSQIEDTQRVINELKDSADKLGVSSRGLITPWGTLTKKGEEFVLQNHIVIKGLNDTEEATNKAAKGFINLTGVISQLNSTADGTINEKLVRSLLFLNQSIEFLEKQMVETDTATKSGREQITLYQREINKLKKEIEEILEPYKDLQEAIKAFKESNKENVNTLLKTTDATLKLADANKELEASVPKESDETRAKVRKELIEEQIELINQYSSVLQSVAQVFSALDELQKQNAEREINAIKEQAETQIAAIEKQIEAKQKLGQETVDLEQKIKDIEQARAQREKEINDRRKKNALTLIILEQAVALAQGVSLATKASTPIEFIAAVASILATIISTISQAKAVANSASFFEGTEYLQKGKNKAGKDTIPVMAHEGEAIIPTDKNLAEPGLAKAWIDGNLDRYIYKNYVMPEMVKSLGKTKSERDYTEKFYRQLIETKETNGIGKKTLHVLTRIERGLTSDYYNKRYNA